MASQAMAHDFVSPGRKALPDSSFFDGKGGQSRTDHVFMWDVGIKDGGPEVFSCETTPH